MSDVIEKTATFTPGFWRVIEKRQRVGFAMYEIAWSDDNELVCDIVYEKADAHLMSAAKEMFEALKLAVGALEEAEAILGGEYGDHYATLCEKMLSLREASEAAIAKATQR